jgi:chemotaxis receptor (MCP) glutamine deamidase CheD
MDTQETSEKTPQSRPPCQILTKKGFLTARNLTSGVALLIYSREFQLGVLFPLSDIPLSNIGDGLQLETQVDETQSFTKSGIAMILTEFQTLGVRRRELLTYAIGGSAVDGKPEVTTVMIRRTLWKHGLSLTASDLGGNQVRSLWMDVETGRTIIRSEPIIQQAHSPAAEVSVAS